MDTIDKFLYAAASCGAGLLLLAVLIVVAIRNAPYGWEDENGFHKGKG